MPKGSKKLAAAMREVHRDEPSTVTRAKHFGPGGKEAMLRAVAYSKARKAGAKLPSAMRHGMHKSPTGDLAHQRQMEARAVGTFKGVKDIDVAAYFPSRPVRQKSGN